MAESFFTSGNQMVTTEIDVDSPVTEGWMSKVKGRDVELSDKIVGLGGGGPYSSDADANGNRTVTANETWSGIKHYNNFTINAGVTVTLEQGKPLIIFARGTVTIDGIIEGDGKGALGGTSGSTGWQGLVGGAGGGGGGISIYSGGDGGSAYYFGFVSIGGGGSSGVGGTGQGAALAKLFSIPHQTNYVLGGGGGGRSGYNSGGGSGGGNGGGFLYIEAPQIIIGGAGVVRCNGITGTTGGANSGGGGGGGGGIVWIKTKSYTFDGVVEANGGAGGGAGSGNAGGAGGAGVLYVENLP